MTPTQHQRRSAGRHTALAIGLAVLATGCSAPPAPQVAPQTSAPAAAAPALAPGTSINQLMVAWIDNASHVLWDVEKPGFAPKDDADWVEIENHAIQLIAAGTMIQMAGTGPSDALWIQQDNWKRDARLLSDAGRAALAAAKSRDLPAVVRANGDLVTTCVNCHKEFKPDAPTEGIVHQNPHSESHRGN